MVRHMPRASVVIPIYQRADMLAPCLAALEADGLGDIELVLVDNGSTDPAMGPLLDAWEGTAVIRRNPVNAGFAAACNQGARAASAPVVVFLNSDTEVRAGWLEPLLDAVSDPGVGMAGSRLLYPDGRIQHAGMALAAGCQPVHLHRGVPGGHPAVTRSRDLLLLTGACCAIARDLFIEHGGLDLSFVNGHEDVDLCLRLTAAGRRTVYRGDSVVIHHESMSPGRMDRDNDNAQLFRRRWHGWAPDWLDLLRGDGICDGGWADCRWEGPLFDAGPEAALGRDAVRALVEEGRRPCASEPHPGRLADDAATLCDDVLLAALNRLRVGAPAAETFRHLREGRPLGTARGDGALIAVAGPGAVAPADIAGAQMAMVAGPQALEMVQAAGMRPCAIAALDPARPRPEAARHAVLGARSPREGIAWMGPLLGRSGYAAAGRGVMQAAAHAGLPVLALIADVALEGLPVPRLPLPPQDFTPALCVAHNPPVLPDGRRVWKEIGITLALPVVGATCFETEGLPPSWVAECNAAREVWVPSAFNVRTFSDAGVDPDLLHAVPYPVDTERLRPAPRERDPDAPVTFLSIFEWTWRKGWDVLLRAWAEEFAHDEPVRLVVVTYRGAGAGAQGSVLDQALGHLRAAGFDPGAVADIDLVLEPVPHTDMPDLYRSADAFVLPTRGEGAGMPVLEAAACGVPVIATAWGGHEELMTAEAAFPVEIERMVEAPPALLVDNGLYEGLVLAEPSVRSLRAQMRALVDDPAGAAARALAGRALVEERFSIAATAAALDARARALLERPVRGVAR
jgi:GT2 family glycosyltransferase/glycosyltransferase involved in cell wall biosynthesis